MSQPFTFISSTERDQLFNNLKFAIEEIRLLRKISDLEQLAFQLKATMPKQQARFIRGKVVSARAELQMARIEAERKMNHRPRA